MYENMSTPPIPEQPGPEQKESTSLSGPVEERAEPAELQVDQEYLESLLQNLKPIKEKIYRLTWEASLTDIDRHDLVQSISAADVAWLIKGLNQPQTAGKIFESFQDFLQVRNTADLRPLIERVVNDPQIDYDKVLAVLTRPHLLEVLKIYEAFNESTQDAPTQTPSEVASVLTHQFIEQRILPRLIETLPSSFKPDAVDFLVQKVEQYGTHDQQSQLHELIIDQIVSNPDGMVFIDRIKQQNLDMERRIEAMEQLVVEGLDHLHLNPDELIPIWRGASELGFDQPTSYVTYDLLAENFKTVVRLEQHQPGLTKMLETEFGIKVQGRYPVEMLIKQIENPPRAGDSFGIIIMPEADHNGTFFYDQAQYRQLDSGLQANQKVVIFEAADLLEVVASINQARKRYAEAGKISFAIIGGHGSEDIIRFGGKMDREYNHMQQRRSILYTDDLFETGAKAVEEAFASDADIILCACETGGNIGLANDISTIMKKALVTAPDISTDISSYEAYTKENGQVGVRAEFVHTVNTHQLGGRHISPQQ